FSSRRRHTRSKRDWSSDVCSSDLTRTAIINVSTYGLGAARAGIAALGRAEGGWLNEGLNAGGWVPGPYPGPGVDNVLWPVRSGLADGGMQMQPLAGTEFVVNGQSAKQWGPALEAINSGMRPSQLVGGVSASVDTGAIASAVSAAMSGWQPMVRLGDREFVGVMRRAE